MKKKHPADPSDTQALMQEIKGFVSNARTLDKKEAEALVTSQCTSIFDRSHVAIASLEQARELAATDKETAFRAKQKIVRALDATSRRLEAPLEDGQTLLANGLRHMRVSDAVQLSLWSVLTCLALYVSYVNLLSVLLASGLPVFLEDETKAMFLAALAPSASFAIKSLPASIKSDAGQTLFKRILIALTGVSVVIWIALFSASYDGLTGDIDLGDLSLEGSDYTSHFLTFFQLSTEILIGSCLFIRFTDTLSIYEFSQKRDNPEFLKLQCDLAQAEVTAKSAEAAYEAATNALHQHLAARQAFINEALARLALYQTQFRDLHQ